MSKLGIIIILLSILVAIVGFIAIIVYRGRIKKRPKDNEQRISDYGWQTIFCIISLIISAESILLCGTFRYIWHFPKCGNDVGNAIALLIGLTAILIGWQIFNLVNLDSRFEKERIDADRRNDEKISRRGDEIRSEMQVELENIPRSASSSLYDIGKFFLGENKNKQAFMSFFRALQFIDNTDSNYSKIDKEIISMMRLDDIKIETFTEEEVKEYQDLRGFYRDKKKRNMTDLFVEKYSTSETKDDEEKEV